ncbi:MAG TPA: hypothetical protein VN734_11810 [Acidobacteriaceae bacterium]|nr:hypothetical protein [Acidobacteriaceae bacterium]
MRTSILYRISSVLILLFAVGHTLGFRKTDPSWGVDQTLAVLKRTTFHIQGFDRTYYGFYAGSGYLVTVFLLFTVVVTWELGRLPAATLVQLPWLRWGLALCYAGVLLLCLRYFFMTPVILSAAIFLCLTAAAVVARRNQ